MSQHSSPKQTPVIPERLTVRILGPLHVQRGTTVLGSTQLGGPKPRQILEILLLRVGAPVSKERLGELFREGSAPAEAMSTLESYVSVLRRHLQPGCGKAGPLKTTNGGYLIDPTLVDLDSQRFHPLLRRPPQADAAQALPLPAPALEMAPAPPLGGELRAARAAGGGRRHAGPVRS